MTTNFNSALLKFQGFCHRYLLCPFHGNLPYYGAQSNANSLIHDQALSHRKLVYISFSMTCVYFTPTKIVGQEGVELCYIQETQKMEH